MIAGIFHQGSGLGNQLHRYIAVRVLALDKGYEFMMLNPENFKGASFMELDMGVGADPLDLIYKFEEKKVLENDVDIRSYDPEINFVFDNTLLEGEFQDERYFIHRLKEIREWLKVAPLEMPDDLCVINFRGGEYKLFPDLFLTKDYWNEAIELMKEKHPNIKFEVHTDDPITAKEFFPDFPVVDSEVLGHSFNSSMGYNWRAIRYAKHLILSNTSFAILPALLNEDVEEIIAPRYWARRNTKVWALPSNYYKKFTYL